MPEYMGTMFFQDVAHGYGWTESYFGFSPDISTFRTAFEVLIGLRADVLIDLCEIAAGRVSDVDIFNDSLLVAGGPFPGQLVSTITSASDPWTALNVRMEAGAEFRGRKFFHGVLESTFQDNRNYAPLNVNAPAWTALFTELNDNWDLRVEYPAFTHYESITNCIPRRATTRKIGRPFDLLRGRQTT